MPNPLRKRLYREALLYTRWAAHAGRAARRLRMLAHCVLPGGLEIRCDVNVTQVRLRPFAHYTLEPVGPVASTWQC